MAKKGTYFASAPLDRLGEKVRREWRDFSLAILFYIVLVIVSAGLGSLGKYDLSKESVHGFVLWFLLLPAYLPLWLAGGVAWCMGTKISFVGHEAFMLGIFDIAQALVVWLLVTVFTFKLRRPSIPRNARCFVRIVIFWGLFQLVCCAAFGLWEHGGLAALHDCHGTQPSVVTAPGQP